MTVEQDIEKKVGVFVTAHHMVLYAALSLVLGAAIYLFVARRADVADEKAQAAITALAVEKDHSQQLAAAYAAAESQREKERAAYLDAIKQIQSQTKVQIIHDKALPAPELGQRLEDQIGFKRGTVTLNSNNDLIVPLPMGQEIVAELDQAWSDSQVVKKQEGIIESQTKTINDLNATIVEDKKVLEAQVKADEKVLSAEKAKARKSKLKWFGAGVVAGAIAREAVSIFVFHKI